MRSAADRPPGDAQEGDQQDKAPAIGPGTWLALLPIRFYRRFISPLMGPRCRYYPTCSTYAMQSVRELGPIRGTIVAGWRVLRCNPMSPGGLDPLENRRLFRSEPPITDSPEPPTG